MYIVKQYKTLSEWRKDNLKEYNSARYRGWINELCELNGWDKPIKSIPYNHWTKERCIKEAKKYDTKTKWSNGSNGSWRVAKKSEWYHECTEHMTHFKSIPGYWTKERCIKEAKKYNTKTEWRKNSVGSHSKAQKSDWYDECTEHMKVFFISQSYWTRLLCIEEAKKYNTKTEWVKGSNSSVNAAENNGWMDECTEHMEKMHSPEGYWTKERCREYAIQYDMKERWKKGHNVSYSHTRKNGWMNELSTHMVEGCKKPNYWTKERCHVEALKFKVKETWKKGQQGSYQAARRNGWVDELCIHMEQPQKPNGYWNNKNRCLENARKFKTITEWTKANSSPVINARKYGWYDECTEHMFRVQVKNKYWQIKENVLNEAKKYKSKGEWAIASSSSYSSSRKNEWFDECVAHMENKRQSKPPNYWTKERCLEEARKYKTKKDWLNGGSGSYSAAKREGWFKECTKHMK